MAKPVPHPTIVVPINVATSAVNPNIFFPPFGCCCCVSLFLKRMIRPSSLQNLCRAKNIIDSQMEILEAEIEGIAKALEHDIMINISLASDQ